MQKNHGEVASGASLVLRQKEPDMYPFCS